MSSRVLTFSSSRSEKFGYWLTLDLRAKHAEHCARRSRLSAQSAPPRATERARPSSPLVAEHNAAYVQPNGLLGASDGAFSRGFGRHLLRRPARALARRGKKSLRAEGVALPKPHQLSRSVQQIPRPRQAAPARRRRRALQAPH